MSATEPTSPTVSQGVVSNILQLFSVKKANPDNHTPPPVPVPADSSLAPVEETTTAPVEVVTPTAKIETKEKLGALGRLKSITGYKKESKTEVPKVKFKDDNAASSGMASEAPAPEVDVPAAIMTELTTTAQTVPPPDPTTFAKLLRSLIDALPSVNPDDPVPKPKPVKTGPDGKPIPPPNSSPIKDSKVIAQLSSPSIMNGTAKGATTSIWSLLEALGPVQHEDESDPGNGKKDEGTPKGPDSSSIMLYAPLIPTDDSVIEVAKSELRPAKRLPLLKDGEKEKVKAKRFSIQLLGKAQPAPPVKLVQVWVPSTTDLSVETQWWGYRLYLPPPVMAVLGQKEAQAIKITAIITTALAWIIDNLPISVVPLPLQPAVLVLKSLAPHLSYIGMFIAWSWANLQGLDQGNGVILTATWLLPIALIPSTWSPPRPVPAPSPPAAPATPGTNPTPTKPTVPSVPAPTAPTVPAPTTPAPAPTDPGSSTPTVEPTSPDKSGTPAKSPPPTKSPLSFTNLFKAKAK